MSTKLYSTYALHANVVPFLASFDTKQELFGKVISTLSEWDAWDHLSTQEEILNLREYVDTSDYEEYGEEYTYTLSDEVDVLQDNPDLMDDIEDDVFYNFISHVLYDYSGEVHERHVRYQAVEKIVNKDYAVIVHVKNSGYAPEIRFYSTEEYHGVDVEEVADDIYSAKWAGRPVNYSDIETVTYEI